MGNTANAAKDGAAHEVICVASKPINDVVVVPDIQLRDLAIGVRERLGTIPSNIVVEIVLVATVS